MNYRREIDGLRAVAVMSVIFFHAGFQWFSGGFVGVDIFFVISGYLITSILLAEMHEGTFTLVGFYDRRARRIFPALFFVMLACLPVAWLWMLPDDFENFGQSLVATTYFGNNVLLWLTSGYFDLANELKPLLHTWSLGVEEQYYVLFPLFLLMFWRFGKHWLVSLLALVAFASFSFAEWGSVHSPDATFYLLPTRGWELLIGAFLAFFLVYYRKQAENATKASLVSELASLVGFVLILLAVFFFDKSTPFPGFFALIPTIGAMLIIAFANQHTIVGRLLAHKMLVGIGLVSYSAYLWHQPLFAFARLRSLDEPSSFLFMILAVVAVGLAYLTWRFVEQPFRNKKLITRKTILVSSIAMGLLVSSVGYVIYINSGFVNLWDELNTDVKAAGRGLNASFNQKPQQFKRVQFLDPQKTHVLVLGNSYARDFINAGLENNYFSTSEISYDGDGVPSCLKSVEDIDEQLRKLISESDYLIYGSPPLSMDCWQSDFDLLKKIGAKKVGIIGTKNFGWNMNAVMRLDASERYNYRANVVADYKALNERMTKVLPESYFVNILAMISDQDGRVPVFTDNRKIISQDTKHLTKEGARFIGKIIFEHPFLIPLK